MGHAFEFEGVGQAVGARRRGGQEGAMRCSLVEKLLFYRIINV